MEEMTTVTTTVPTTVLLLRSKTKKHSDIIVLSVIQVLKQFVLYFVNTSDSISSVP